MTTGSGDGAWQEAFAVLVRAQARTEEQFAILAAAQGRTDQRLEALAAAQERTADQLSTLTERVDRLTERVDTLAIQLIALTARVDALTARVDALTERVDRLTEQMTLLTARVDALTQRVDRLTEQMAALVARVDTLNDKVGELTGWAWEARYRDRAPAYLGRLMRHVRVLPASRLASVLDAAVAGGRLSEADMDEIERADLICSGRRREDGAAAYLVVEVSAGVRLSDVQRAARRAELLARTGTPALAVVAGERFHRDAQEAASELGAWQVSNGKTVDPTEQGSAASRE